MSIESRIDALPPADMAARAVEVGAAKAAMPFSRLFPLAVMAGAYVALGSMFATLAASGAASLPYGIVRILFGLVFCIGLILIVVGGAELFTGNILLVMGWASRKVGTRPLLRNWAWVYLGNFTGALATAGLIFLAKHYTFGSGAVGETALKIAVSKVNLGFLQAVALGMLCNGLVCLAIWLTYSARTLTDKILAILFPITAFAAAGFEHSIANMYFIPYALMIKTFDPAFVARTGLDLSSLTWGTFLLRNLLPVTLGNILGGAGLVGILYWFVFLRRQS